MSENKVTNIGNDKKGFYQPNLMCWYDHTKDTNDRVRVLVVRNKEDIGINDEQMVDALWAYALDFKRRLDKEKKYDSNVKEIQIPPCSMIDTCNEKRTVFTLTVASMDPNSEIKDEGFWVFLTNFCQQKAKILGIELITPQPQPQGGANDWDGPGPRNGA